MEFDDSIIPVGNGAPQLLTGLQGHIDIRFDKRVIESFVEKKEIEK